MKKQPRNNRTTILPTPAVENTINVINRNLIAMTITDIDSCVALVCSTERVRIRSRNSRNASPTKHVAVQNLCYFLCWLFPGE